MQRLHQFYPYRQSMVSCTLPAHLARLLPLQCFSGLRPSSCLFGNTVRARLSTHAPGTASNEKHVSLSADASRLSADSLSSPAPPTTTLLTRYACVVEYDGSRYHGWAQSKERGASWSVSGAIEAAIALLQHGKQTRITASGRTDRGVHALGQVFTVDLERPAISPSGKPIPPLPPMQLVTAVNHFLFTLGHVPSIQLLHASIIPSDIPFHARHSATNRSYLYRVFNSPHLCSLFERDRCAHVKTPLHVSRMQEALNLMQGLHDYVAFQSNGCSAKSSMRNISRASLHVTQQTVREQLCNWEMVRDDTNTSTLSDIASPLSSTIPSVTLSDKFPDNSFPSQWIEFHFTSRGFLYHQIRNMMGVALAIGRDEWTLQQLETLLAMDSARAQRDEKYMQEVLKARQKVGTIAAPPAGLFLRQVEYPWDFMNDWKMIRPMNVPFTPRVLSNTESS